MLILHSHVSVITSVACIYVFLHCGGTRAVFVMHFPVEGFYSGIRLQLEVLSVAFPELDFCGCCPVALLGLLMLQFVR